MNYDEARKLILKLLEKNIPSTYRESCKKKFKEISENENILSEALGCEIGTTIEEQSDSIEEVFRKYLTNGVTKYSDKAAAIGPINQWILEINKNDNLKITEFPQLSRNPLSELLKLLQAGDDDNKYQGLTQEELAEKMFVTERSIRTYINTLMYEYGLSIEVSTTKVPCNNGLTWKKIYRMKDTWHPIELTLDMYELTVLFRVLSLAGKYRTKMEGLPDPVSESSVKMLSGMIWSQINEEYAKPRISEVATIHDPAFRNFISKAESYFEKSASTSLFLVEEAQKDKLGVLQLAVKTGLKYNVTFLDGSKGIYYIKYDRDSNYVFIPSEAVKEDEPFVREYEKISGVIWGKEEDVIDIFEVK